MCAAGNFFGSGNTEEDGLVLGSAVTLVPNYLYSTVPVLVSASLK